MILERDRLSDSILGNKDEESTRRYLGSEGKRFIGGESGALYDRRGGGYPL